MSQFNKENTPHHILPSDSNTKQEDETQKDFKPNNKKFLINSARIIEKNPTEDGKYNHKTEIEEVGVVIQTNNDASMARDEKVMQAEQNEYYVFFNRLLYSKKCIVIYALVIVFDCAGIGNLVASYFIERLSK